MAECEEQASVTVPDDRLALETLAGAATGVLSGHGAAARVQAGTNGATNALNQASLSDSALTDEIRHAAEWRSRDCLKQRGWDSMPRFMFRRQ
jgi:hypothetical protein